MEGHAVPLVASIYGGSASPRRPASLGRLATRYVGRCPHGVPRSVETDGGCGECNRTAYLGIRLRQARAAFAALAQEFGAESTGA